MFDIDENLKMLPDKPGVYIHKDKLGQIIYVGKAVSLRNRVRQYFQSKKNMQPKVRSMVEQIAEFEYITVDSEMEALVLECNLIKKHQPKYNILLRDDKTYPFIKVTNEEWPRIIKTRIYKKDGGSYFGPYSDVGAVNRIVDLLNATFNLKRCSTTAFPSNFRPCLNYHIGQCSGICTGLARRGEYMSAISEATDFLKGNDGRLVERLKEKMVAAAESMEYEEAAEYRDYIEAAKVLSETQRVVLHHSSEADIVVRVGRSASMTEEGLSDGVHIAVFKVRDGKLVGRESFKMDAELSIDDAREDVIAAFINQHYGAIPNVPKEILVETMPTDTNVLEELLSESAGHKVRITKPERGEKRALLKLAVKDAVEMAKTVDARAKAHMERKERLGREIWTVLCEMGEMYSKADGRAYDGREFRVEAYDISNTNGVDTVGAMIVFQGLKPDKNGYRKFKVRTVQGQDDYGSMREVLTRRFLRVFNGDDKFSVLPDVILMDGGKGHVSTALEVIEQTGLDIPVVGMVKDDHHRTRALVYRVSEASELNGASESAREIGLKEEFETEINLKQKFEWREISLADKPLLYKYIGTVQEEVHRFAIEYHRKLRNKNVEKSILDEIDGIGAKRRRALLEAFGSVENIKNIVLADTTPEGADISNPVYILSNVEGMNRAAAEKVCDFFRLMV